MCALKPAPRPESDPSVSRQPFTLHDDQAARLVRALGPIVECHPPDSRSNRPFLRAFIRAVHGATGRTYSPAIYRRLLNAYAPDRRPSTTTLALEKEFVEHELAAGAREYSPADTAATAPTLQASSVSTTELTNAVRETVEELLNKKLMGGSPRWENEQQMAQAHIADLTARLAAADRALNEARAQAARLAADLQLAQEAAARYHQQLATTEQAAGNQAEAQLTALKDVTTQLDEIRKFAMRSIDDIRGETRAERERRIHAEELLKQNQKMMEVFRQMAYQRGGSIPPDLRTETK
jgi:hypothetical protein